MQDLYSVDTVNGDKEKFARVEGRDDLSEDASRALDKALEDGADDDPEQGASNDGKAEKLSNEEVVEINIALLSGVPNEFIRQCNEEYDGYGNERDVITANMALLMAKIKAKGVDTDMFKAANKRGHRDAHEQELADISFSKCCYAADTGQQKDFFKED